MSVNSLADIFLLTSIVPVGAFIALLLTRSRWLDELATRTIAFAAGGTFVVLIQNTLSVWISTDYIGRPWVRVILYAVLNAGWWAAVWALVHYQNRGRR